MTVEILISFKQHKQMSQSSAIIWLHLQYYVCSSKHFLNDATKLYIEILNNKGNTIIIIKILWVYIADTQLGFWL